MIDQVKKVLISTLAFLLFFGPLSCDRMYNQFLGIKLSPKKDILYVGLGPATVNFDWNRAEDIGSLIVAENVMGGLTYIDPTDSTSKPLPFLSSSWESKQDNRVFIFKLKNEIKWMDKSLLNASQVVAGIKGSIDPKSKSACVNLFSDLKGFDAFRKGEHTEELGVIAKDEHTVEFTLRQGNIHFPVFLSHPCSFPIRASLEGNQLPVTLGPFGIDRYIPGKYLTLKPHLANSLGRRPRLRGLVFGLELNAEEQLKFFKSSKLDMVFDLPASVTSEESLKPETLKIPNLGASFLIFDSRKKPFHNPIFRRATSMAINREELAGQIISEPIPATSLIPPGVFGFESNRGMRFDPLALEELLENSGYGDLEKYGKFYLVHEPGEENLRVVTFVKAQLEKNFTMEIELKEVKKFPWGEKPVTQGPTMYLHTMKLTSSEPLSFLRFFQSTEFRNLSSWKFPKFDQIMNQLSSENSESDETKAIAKAQHFLTEGEIPIVPLLFTVNTYLVKERVKGLIPDRRGFFNFTSVEVE